MSQVFEKIVIGFGNSNGQTSVRILSQYSQKINRVDIKSQFGPNPKVTIKAIPQINLAPFTQMIFQKRDQQTLQQLLKGNIQKGNNSQVLLQIKRKSQKDFQQLRNQLQFLQNCQENQQLDTIISKTGCKQYEGKQYLEKYKNANKAIEMIKEHKKLIQQVSKKFNCTQDVAKELLQASNYDMSVLG